jgi:hypothetical protein
MNILLLGSEAESMPWHGKSGKAAAVKHSTLLPKCRYSQGRHQYWTQYARFSAGGRFLPDKNIQMVVVGRKNL